MRYRDKFFGYPLSVVCLNEVDNNDPQRRVIYLKGYFKERFTENATYRLYKRYIDFNLDKVSTILTELDEQDENKSIFMVGIFKIAIRKKILSHLLS
jgi:hypothetical protein